MLSPKDLSESEMEVMRLMARNRSVLTSSIMEKSGKDDFGWPVAGMPIYRKLIKKGLVFETEEEPMSPDNPEAGTWTPSIELTQEGEEFIRTHISPPRQASPKV